MNKDTVFTSYGRSVPSSGKKNIIANPQLSHSLDLGEMFGIHFINMILTTVTFGIYQFWAKTRVRRTVLANLHFADHPFQYTGTGGELFKGAMLISGVVVLPMTLVIIGLPFAYESIFSLPIARAGDLAQISVLPVIWVLLGIGIHRARRYRLSRIRWRGVHGYLDGNSFSFGLKWLGHFFMQIVTLGLWGPKMDTFMLRNLVGCARIGNEGVMLRIDARRLYSTYVVCWLLAIPTLTLSFAWYRAKLAREAAQGLHLQGLNFSSDITAWRLISFHLVNLLILVFTLGIGMPLIWKRSAELLIDTLHISGKLDATRILSTRDQMAVGGEGIASVFDVDAF